MGSLVDIGGGFKQFVPSGGAFGSSAGGSLVKLQSQIENLPFQALKLKAETKLKVNEVQNIELDNIKKNMDVMTAIGNERRAQNSEFTKTIGDIFDLAKFDINLAVDAFRQIRPDAEHTINKDGTATVSYSVNKPVQQKDGSFKMAPSEEKTTFIINPKQITPEKRFELEGQWNSKFTGHEVVKRYSAMTQAFLNLKDLASKGTGASDLGIVNVFSKLIQGGTGLVTESDVQNAMRTVGFSDEMSNKITKAWAADAPIFGKKGVGIARQNFVDAAKPFYMNAGKDVRRIGRDFAELAEREGLDARNILTPVGDIAEEHFLMSDEELKKKLGLGGSGGK